ncbi:hypothetical protein ATB97_17890 [Elizabethkingia bruuniana]|nr:hypothetical protein AYC65_13295 [Elizabethkingia bruuniana]KGO10792.1 hypothetical protein KS04_07830 [Elizabethkingia miricola]KUY27575.1 hypothetical protein ATB97_17890 [Elizabethkingia bruuniana]OPB63702.1 hypothetical protein BAY12_09955 [Elizabethkingia bruuniana]
MSFIANIFVRINQHPNLNQLWQTIFVNAAEPKPIVYHLCFPDVATAILRKEDIYYMKADRKPNTIVNTAVQNLQA